MTLRGGSTNCEACGGPLCGVGPAKTGIRGRCRMDGAAFARAWIADLRDAGYSPRETADIVGVRVDAARARLSEHRRRVA